jgi:inorganic pyrophosphatase/exopolyphosphatase
VSVCTSVQAHTAFFQQLFEAKADTASLTVDELLRKDYKQWLLPTTTAGAPYGIAAVPSSLADFLGRSERLADALEACCVANGRLAFLLCMTFTDHPDFQRYGPPHRKI